MAGKRRSHWLIRRDGVSAERGILTSEERLEEGDEVEAEGQRCWVVSVGDLPPEDLADEYDDLYDGSLLLRPVSEREKVYVYELVREGSDAKLPFEFSTHEPAWREGDSIALAEGFADVLRREQPEDPRYHARLVVRRRSGEGPSGRARSHNRRS